MATYQACQVIGMPECRINLAHLVTYLAEAPKSTRAYEGYNRAEEAAKLDPSITVPLMMRNAPTGLMKQLGYARGYRYNPEYACVFVRIVSLDSRVPLGWRLTWLLQASGHERLYADTVPRGDVLAQGGRHGGQGVGRGCAAAVGVRGERRKTVGWTPTGRRVKGKLMSR